VYFCALWLSDAHAQSPAQLSGTVRDATSLPRAWWRGRRPDAGL